jgi:DNA-binding IclR family transcriptional regulator
MIASMRKELLLIAFARGNDQARAALTIAGISRRMQPQRLSSLVEHLQHYADRIEKSYNELDQS